MVSKRVAKKKTNETIKRELLNSFPNSQEAININNRYKDIIKAQDNKNNRIYR